MDYFNIYKKRKSLFVLRRLVIRLFSESHLMESLKFMAFAKRGTRIFLEQNIRHYEEHKIEDDKMQLVTIRVQQFNKDLKISPIYCPPRSRVNKIETVHDSSIYT